MLPSPDSGKSVLIDCSVARSASDKADPVAKLCRETLDELRGLQKHRFLTSTQWKAEIDKHCREHSYFIAMLAEVASQGRLDFGNTSSWEVSVTTAITESIVEETHKEGLHKDWFLVALMMGGVIVVTRDRKFVHNCYQCRFDLERYFHTAQLIYLQVGHKHANEGLLGLDKAWITLGCPFDCLRRPGELWICDSDRPSPRSNFLSF